MCFAQAQSSLAVASLGTLPWPTRQTGQHRQKPTCGEAPKTNVWGGSVAEGMGEGHWGEGAGILTYLLHNRTPQ